MDYNYFTDIVFQKCINTESQVSVKDTLLKIKNKYKLIKNVAINKKK